MSSKILFTSKSFNFNMEHKIQLSGLRRESDSKMQRCVFQCNVSGWTKKHKIHLGLKDLFVLKSFVLLDSMIQMTHIYTSDSAFRVGN